MIIDITKLSDENLEQEKDTLGGGSFELLESDVYTLRVKNAYFTTSSGGAVGLKLELLVKDKGTSDNPYIYRETLWVTNKQGQQYYERDGKKIPLPGFTHARNICLVCANKPLHQMKTTEKIVKEYDSTAKAEVDKSVPVLSELEGKVFKGAILHTRANKMVQNQETKAWVETNEEAFSNSLAKVFTMDGRTLGEQLADKDPEFMTKWLEKYKGKLNDKFKAGKSVSPSTNSKVSATIENASDWD